MSATEQEPQPPGGGPSPPTTFTIPPALAAGVALVVAGLAAVGVTGDALTKAVRNEPQLLAIAVIAALATTVAFVVVTLGNRLVAAGLVLLLLAVSVAIWIGAESVADREQPLVTLSSAPESSGSRIITIEVSAAGLRTTDRLLVQVIGLRDFSAVSGAVDLCEADRFDSVIPANTGVLLLWNRIGPDHAGDVKATIKIAVPTNKFQGVCAWAPLPSKINKPQDQRNSAAYLRLITASK